MSKQKMDIAKKKCITHEFRVSFPAVLAPKGFEEQAPKYSCVMLFDKKVDLSKAPVNKEGKPIGISMKAAALNAATEMWGPKEKWPKGLKLPFRDGDEKSDTPGYENTIYVTASSKHQPGLVNLLKQPITSETEFYAGCYARAELIAFAYDKAGNKGVSFSLQNIKKLKDGPKFSGRKDAAEAFDEIEDTVEDGSNDEANYTENDSDSQSLGF